MKLELTGPQLAKIAKAVNKSYGGSSYSIDLLANAVKAELPNRSVFDYVVANHPFTLQVSALLTRANGEGWLPSLLGALWHEKPDELQEILRSALATVPARQALDLAEGTLPAETKVELQQILPGGCILKPQTLRRRMRCVCRVDYADHSPPGYGTGFLVAPDLVLTNWHVVRRVLDAPAEARARVAAELRFRFDLVTSADAADNRGRVSSAELSSGCPILRTRPAAGMELEGGTGEPGMTALDYALVRLRERVGDDLQAGGEARGTIALRGSMPQPAVNAALMVLQHPLRSELQFAIGTVLGPNATGSRVKHTAATQGGSSGAPVLDVALAPLALHNGARSGTEIAGKPYNTAVPLAHIVEDLKEAGITEMLLE